MTWDIKHMLDFGNFNADANPEKKFTLNFHACGNQSANDIKDFFSVNMDV
jgi:hypothetical protein